MSVLPPERYPVLLVHPNAATSRLIALEQLKPISRGNGEIFDSRRCVDQPEFALNATPQLARDSPCRARVSFAKQIGRRVVRKRLNHTSVTHYTNTV